MQNDRMSRDISRAAPIVTTANSNKLEKTITIGIAILNLPVEARAQFGSSETIFSFHFGDISLGEILLYLVSKAEPGFQLQLDPPWDQLNAINLKNLVIELDATNNRFGFRYENLGFSLPLVTLDAFEVWYSPKTQAGRKSVDISFYGTFLGADYTKAPGLTWDLLNQPPPDAGPKGNKYLDLCYLGLGQHVTLRDSTSTGSMKEVMKALQASYRDVVPEKQPLDSLPGLKFDASSGWLVGAEFTALETLSLQVIFNDPVMYGVRIGLVGDRAGKLAGLEFEILYRKIADGLGVYHIELKLPDAMRYIQAGEATLILPIIDLDIYTNGNFLLDIGFPKGLDFSRSFTFEVIVWVGPIPLPVTGALGLYFGVLDGQTSSQVPAISNGYFSPVIVFGLGINIGLGKSIELGILKAGFFIGFIGIVEGALAWFNPSTPGVEKDTYVKLSGTVAIVGHIWGTVDFAIVKASVDIYAYASAQLVIESHQPILVTFEAGVRVMVRIKILFFYINLSFSATIRESFKIGSATQAPWVLSQGRSGDIQTAPPMLYRRLRSVGAPLESLFALRMLATGVQWHAAALRQGAAAPLLALTVYFRPPVSAGLMGDKPKATVGSKAQTQLVAMLFLAHRGDGVPEDNLSPYEQLSARALGWVIEAVQETARQLGDTANSETVTLSHLHFVYDDLTSTNPTVPVDFNAVSQFLTANISFEIDPLDSDQGGKTFTIFPMMPYLTLTPGSGTTIDFSEFQPCSASYRKDLKAYFEMLAAPKQPGVDNGPTGMTTAPDESMAMCIFTDYFLMLLRQVVESAIEAMECYPYLAQSGDSMPALVNRFGLKDDAIAALAQANQAVAEHDYVIMAGDTLTTIARKAGVSVEALAEPNHGVGNLFRPGTFVDGHTVVTGETLAMVAEALGKTVDDVAKAVASDTTVLQPWTVITLPVGLFKNGTVLAISERVVKVSSGESFLSLATRLELAPGAVAHALKDEGDLLAEGTELQIRGGTYTVAAGDNLSIISGKLGNLSISALASALASVPNLLVAGQSIPLPGGGIAPISVTDTLASIADANSTSVADLSQAAKSATILLAGITVPLPTVTHAVQAGQTLQNIADAYQILPSTIVSQNVDASPVFNDKSAPFPYTTLTTQGQSLNALVATFYPDSSGAAATAQAVRIAVTAKDQAGLLKNGSSVCVPSGGRYILRTGDTKAALAARFFTTQAALTAANPGLFEQVSPTGQSVPVGQTMVVPATTYTVAPTDTFASIAANFGMDVTTLAVEATNHGSTELLAPLCSLCLPPLTATVVQGDTPLAIAKHFGIDVLSLVEANLDVDFGVVVIPDCEVLPVSDLQTYLGGTGDLDKPAATLARFLLHGLRLPDPTTDIPQNPADAVLYPLYNLTGQQWVAPESKDFEGYTIKLGKSSLSPAPIITFAGQGSLLSTTLSTDQTDTIKDFNAILGDVGEPIPSKPIAFTEFPPYAWVPYRFSLGRPIPLMSPDPPVLSRVSQAETASNGKVSQPQLFKLPTALIHQIEQSGGGPLDLELVTGTRASATSSLTTEPVTGFGWTTMLDFGIRQTPVPDKPGQVVEGVYELSCEDQNASNDLKALIDYIEGSDKSKSKPVDIRLFYAPNPNASNSGLQSDTIDPALIVLLKTNLSTRTTPPLSMTMLLAADIERDPPILTSATLSSPSERANFLKLLWEASVTNSGGYFLFYKTAGQDPKGFPSSVFNETPVGRLTVLVTLFVSDSTTETVAASGFHNSLLLTAGLGNPDAALFVEAPATAVGSGTLGAVAAGLDLDPKVFGAANATVANLLPAGTIIPQSTYVIQPGDDLLTISLATGQELEKLITNLQSQQVNPEAQIWRYPEWVDRQATTLPGSCGFRLLRTDPYPDASSASISTQELKDQLSAQTQLEAQFNLLGYQILDSDGFVSSPRGLPIGPVQPDDGAPNQPPSQNPISPPWAYQRLLAVAAFAKQQPTPGPISGQDPYAGLGSNVSFCVEYNDIYGNQLLPPQQLKLSIPVLYRDDIVPLSQWPASVLAYSFRGTAPNAQLDISIRFDTSQYVPPPGSAFSQVQARAQAHLAKYEQIYFQVSQPDVRFLVTTTMDGEAAHDQLKASIFVTLVTQAHAYLATVADMSQVALEIQASASLEELATAWQVTAADLGEANKSAPYLLNEGASLIVSYELAAVQNDTLKSLAARFPWDTITAGTVANLNPDASLQVGTTLVIGKPYTVLGTDTLKSIAEEHGRTAEDLGLANIVVTGLLLEGVALKIAGLDYTTTAEDTIQNIANTLNVAVATVATDIGPTAGLLQASAILTIPADPSKPTYLTVASDTLGGVATKFGLTPTEIGSANGTVKNLLIAGVQLCLGSWEHTIEAGETFESIGKLYGLPAHAIAETNKASTTILFSGTGPDGHPVTITIPSHVRMGSDQSRVHQVVIRDTFDTIAALAQSTAGAVAAGNAALCGLLAEGASVYYPGIVDAQTVRKNDTLATLLSRFTPPQAGQQLSASDLATDPRNNDPSAPILAVGGTLLLPPENPQLSVSIAAGKYPDVIFQVQTEVTITRTANVDPTFFGTAAESTATVFKPELSGAVESAAGETTGLQNFALAFEAAFASVKLCTGPSEKGAPGDGSAGLLVAMQYQSDVLSYHLQSDASFFAPRPISNVLWASKTPIPILPYANGQLGETPTQKSFRGIDLDRWGAEFLATMDKVLGAEYAVAAHHANPEAFAALVAAKQTLAEAISETVENTFAPGPAGSWSAGSLSAAQKALQDRLLISLSTAYTVSTIIQLPAMVTSPNSAPWSDATTAPRLFGQPCGRTYAIPSGGTLQSVANDFKIPEDNLDILLNVIEDYPYILSRYFNVNYGGTTVQVGPSDTLASVATALKAPSVAELVAQGTGMVGQRLATAVGFLEDGASLNITRRVYAFTSDDTLFTAIDYLALSIQNPTEQSAVADRFAALNSTVPNVFQTDKTIRVQGQNYKTRKGDTLEDIAKRIGTTVDNVVDATLVQADLVQAGTVVALLTRVPGFTLSSAKLTLVHDGEPTLTFLLDTSSNTEYSNLSLDLAYQVTEVEYNLTSVAWASGYQASNWLTFVLPDAAHSNIGMVDVPVPLRAFPSPPIMKTQTAIPDYQRTLTSGDSTFDSVSVALNNPADLPLLIGGRTDLLLPLVVLKLPNEDLYVVKAGDSLDSIAKSVGTNSAKIVGANASRKGLLRSGVLITDPASPSLDQLKKFTYQFTYGYKRAPQDELSHGHTANIKGVTPAADPDSVGAPLAQFASIAEALNTDLAWLPKLNSGANTPELQERVKNAVASLATVAQQVAAGWQQSAGSGGAAPSLEARSADPDRVEFRVLQHTLRNGERHVTGLPKNSGAMALRAAPRVALAHHETLPSPVPGLTMAFRSLIGTESSEDLVPTDTFTYTVGGLDVIGTQNIQGFVSVTRNSHLVAGQVTNANFVYQTEDSKFPSKLIPLFRFDDPVDMVTSVGDTDVDTATLTQRLTTFFTAFLSSQQQTVEARLMRVEVNFSYPLTAVDGSAPIVTNVPTFLAPATLVPNQGGTVESFCSALASKMSEWRIANPTPENLKNSSMWVLDVSLYATLGTGNSSSNPPLLELTEVRLLFSDIS